MYLKNIIKNSTEYKKLWYNEFMNKYDLLWKEIDIIFKQIKQEKLTLSFEELERLGEVAIDHSFLKFKKELESLGYQVEKISLKQKQIIFRKI